MTRVHIEEKFNTSLGIILITENKTKYSIGERIVCDDETEYTIKGIQFGTRPNDSNMVSLIVE